MIPRRQGRARRRREKEGIFADVQTALQTFSPAKGSRDAARDVFDSYDVNGDGKVTHSDFQQAIQALRCNFTSSECRVLAQALDEHNEGLVDTRKLGKTPSALKQRRATRYAGRGQTSCSSPTAVSSPTQAPISRQASNSSILSFDEWRQQFGSQRRSGEQAQAVKEGGGRLCRMNRGQGDGSGGSVASSGKGASRRRSKSRRRAIRRRFDGDGAATALGNGKGYSLRDMLAFKEENETGGDGQAAHSCCDSGPSGSVMDNDGGCRRRGLPAHSYESEWERARARSVDKAENILLARVKKGNIVGLRHALGKLDGNKMGTMTPHEFCKAVTRFSPQVERAEAEALAEEYRDDAGFIDYRHFTEELEDKSLQREQARAPRPHTHTPSSTGGSGGGVINGSGWFGGSGGEGGSTSGSVTAAPSPSSSSSLHSTSLTPTSNGSFAAQGSSSGSGGSDDRVFRRSCAAQRLCREAALLLGKHHNGSAKKLLKMADRDGDGAVNEAELKGAMQQLGGWNISEHDLSGIFRLLDRDGKGRVMISDISADLACLQTSFDRRYFVEKKSREEEVGQRWPIHFKHSDVLCQGDMGKAELARGVYLEEDGELERSGRSTGRSNDASGGSGRLDWGHLDPESRLDHLVVEKIFDRVRNVQQDKRRSLSTGRINSRGGADTVGLLDFSPNDSGGVRQDRGRRRDRGRSRERRQSAGGYVQHSQQRQQQQWECGSSGREEDLQAVFLHEAQEGGGDKHNYPRLRTALLNLGVPLSDQDFSTLVAKMRLEQQHQTQQQQQQQQQQHECKNSGLNSTTGDSDNTGSGGNGSNDRSNDAGSSGSQPPSGHFHLGRQAENTLDCGIFFAKPATADANDTWRTTMCEHDVIRRPLRRQVPAPPVSAMSMSSTFAGGVLGTSQDAAMMAMRARLGVVSGGRFGCSSTTAGEAVTTSLQESNHTGSTGFAGSGAVRASDPRLTERGVGTQGQTIFVYSATGEGPWWERDGGATPRQSNDRAMHRRGRQYMPRGGGAKDCIQQQWRHEQADADGHGTAAANGGGSDGSDVQAGGRTRSRSLPPSSRFGAWAGSCLGGVLNGSDDGGNAADIIRRSACSTRTGGTYLNGPFSPVETITQALDGSTQPSERKRRIPDWRAKIQPAPYAISDAALGGAVGGVQLLAPASAGGGRMRDRTLSVPSPEAVAAAVDAAVMAEAARGRRRASSAPCARRRFTPWVTSSENGAVDHSNYNFISNNIINNSNNSVTLGGTAAVATGGGAGATYVGHDNLPPAAAGLPAAGYSDRGRPHMHFAPATFRSVADVGGGGGSGSSPACTPRAVYMMRAADDCLGSTGGSTATVSLYAGSSDGSPRRRSPSCPPSSPLSALVKGSILKKVWE